MNYYGKEISFKEYCVLRAEQILMKTRHSHVQVRYLDEQIRSYKYPAERGYGVHGELIGIYDYTANIQWILDDIESFMKHEQN